MAQDTASLEGLSLSEWCVEWPSAGGSQNINIAPLAKKDYHTYNPFWAGLVLLKYYTCCT